MSHPKTKNTPSQNPKILYKKGYFAALTSIINIAVEFSEEHFEWITLKSIIDLKSECAELFSTQAGHHAFLEIHKLKEEKSFFGKKDFWIEKSQIQHLIDNLERLGIE